MNLRVGLISLCGLAIPLAAEDGNPFGPPPTPEQAENARRNVMKMLLEQKLPRVAFETAKVREAFDFFAVQTHRSNIGINMVVSFGEPPQPAQLITIHRRNMPLKDFLDEVCKQGGMKWVIEYPGLIRITPK